MVGWIGDLRHKHDFHGQPEKMGENEMTLNLLIIMKNIIERLGVSKSGWVKAEAAPVDQIEELLRTYPYLPTDYISLLRISNGGEGELNLPPRWLQLYDAKFVAELASDEIAK